MWIQHVAFGCTVERLDGNDQERRGRQQTNGQETAQRIACRVPNAEPRECSGAMSADFAMNRNVHPKPDRGQTRDEQSSAAAEECGGPSFMFVNGVSG